MTDGAAVANVRLVRTAAVLLLVAVGIRSLASVAAGFVEWHDSARAGFPDGRFRAGDVLTTFGAAGDGTGILLAVAAAAAVWWCIRVGDGAAATLRLAVTWAFVVVAALAVLSAIGVELFDSFGRQTSHTVAASGYALAYLVVAVGGIAALRTYDAAIAASVFPADDIDAFVFAVDRKSGDVRAFLSGRQAVQGMHVYWVEDDEFAFYTDEGVVLDASVVDDRVVLHPTTHVRRAELLTALREFVTHRGIHIDLDDADEPAAYAVPIARWQGLELWPPWLRPLGLLFRPRK